jgi:hypothetical protein
MNARLALPNNTFDRAAGSHPIAAAGQRQRYTAAAMTRDEREGR